MKGVYGIGRSAVLVIGLMFLVAASGCAARRGAGAGSAAGSAAGAGGNQGLHAEALGGESSLLQFEDSGTVVAGGPIVDIPFAFDSDSLSRESEAVVEQNVRWFGDHPGTRVEVEGHCDERGTSEYNLGLGARRARVVRDALVEAGVSSDRLSTVSYGEELPLCKESTESCWARNRRAHLVALAR